MCGRGQLAARLDLPLEPRDYALFAHCFARGYDIFAVTQIAKALCARGIAVPRFDFTGISACENTTPGRRCWSATTWMGWAIAESRVPEARGVVTVGAPASGLHVTNKFCR
jgi:uncharacterized protein